MNNNVKKVQDTITQIAKENGVGVGDVIQKLTRYFNLKHCSRCERTKQFLNKFRIINWTIKWDDIKDL